MQAITEILEDTFSVLIIGDWRTSTTVALSTSSGFGGLDVFGRTGTGTGTSSLLIKHVTLSN